MPRPKKYPLEALRTHRDREVDDAKVALANDVRERERAEVAREHAANVVREAEAVASAMRDEERELLARGELRAGDLAQQQNWEVAVQAEKATLDGALVRADRAVDEAQAAEALAKRTLATRKVERDVIARDEARFVERLNRANEAREEEEAAEAWQMPVPRQTSDS